MRDAERLPSDLAIFGGEPAFADAVHVGRPNAVDRGRLMARIGDLLDRGWLTNDGPLVRELEQRIAEMMGVDHCVAMCNGTVALEIVIRALELRGEVIVPAMTFVATAHALQWQEITPVFCDIDPGTLNIDPNRVEDMITPRTSGVIGVHLYGRPCDTSGLAEVCAQHSLRLLFDAAHAFGCSHQGRMIGNFGDAEVFSFHATKFFNTFEGGAVTTNDRELADKMRLMRNFGFSGYDNVIYIGTNGKMNEVAAAMGLTGLESLSQVIEVNRRNYGLYQKGLRGLNGVELIAHDESERRNYQYVVLDFDGSRTGVNRDDMLAVLHAENVLARRYFYPGCHRMEPYRSLFPHAGLLLPETDRWAERVLALPTGSAVEPEGVERVCGIIRLAVENAAEVSERLRSAQPEGAPQ